MRLSSTALSKRWILDVKIDPKSATTKVQWVATRSWSKKSDITHSVTGLWRDPLRHHRMSVGLTELPAFHHRMHVSTAPLHARPYGLEAQSCRTASIFRFEFELPWRWDSTARRVLGSGSVHRRGQITSLWLTRRQKCSKCTNKQMVFEIHVSSVSEMEWLSKRATFVQFGQPHGSLIPMFARGQCIMFVTSSMQQLFKETCAHTTFPLRVWLSQSSQFGVRTRKSCTHANISPEYQMWTDIVWHQYNYKYFMHSTGVQMGHAMLKINL